MLYILSRSPYNFDLKALLRTVQLGDCLLLLSDGVIAGLSGTSAWRLLSATNLTLYALLNDITARGLTTYFSRNIIMISYTDFVGLTEKHPQCMAW
ncbi:sulfurtransferase complex subunit TusB [Candidatus Hoaglandella endobia]|uniref:Protein TusB n=1 Tax=Candidatus Hoaglandella endobia TaxID=1778263 RepID=A0A143WUH1_9ENTR|nr:sulfurtransferase complex subunit TusB [Candidatus Hoaglandella endobia]CUX97365.1 Protein TusB [Candidatus Hoaglandella endobia]